jgi:Protein of unknown function (DUF664)
MPWAARMLRIGMRPRANRCDGRELVGRSASGENVVVENDRDEERTALLHFLEYQRASVLSIVEGLSEEAWHTPVVPSGWTPAGMVEHLGDAERHWFLGVVEDADEELAWDIGRPAYDPDAAFTCDRSSDEVLGYYREQCERANEVLARTSMSAAPRGRHGDDEADEEVPTVRWVVLHVIEETAAHSGHLEIAREVLDGRTNAGLR